MEKIGIFEAKVHLSEICEKVSKSHEPIVITKRGVPLVRIDPVTQPEQNRSEIWVARQRFIAENGQIDEEIE